MHRDYCVPTSSLVLVPLGLVAIHTHRLGNPNETGKDSVAGPAGVDLNSSRIARERADSTLINARGMQISDNRGGFVWFVHHGEQVVRWIGYERSAVR
jgi:hypothetical protein